MSDTDPASVATRTWPTFVLLAALWVVVLADQSWVFGTLLLAWAAHEIAAGESRFLQRILRARRPVAFWAVQLTWIALGVLWIVDPT